MEWSEEEVSVWWMSRWDRVERGMGGMRGSGCSGCRDVCNAVRQGRCVGWDGMGFVNGKVCHVLDVM